MHGWKIDRLNMIKDTYLIQKWMNNTCKISNKFNVWKTSNE